MNPPAPVQVPFDNVQGLIVRPYTHPVSCYELVHFDTPAGARAFLKAIVPLVTSAQPWGANVPRRLLNIGLSYTGIQAAQALSPAALAWLPEDFTALPPSETLGDTGIPTPWWDAAHSVDFHCLVSLWADAAATLDDFIRDIESAARAAGVTVLRVRPDGEKIRGALFSEMRKLHFDYLDGISAPNIGWADPVEPPQIDFRYYLLGYGTLAIQSTPQSLPGVVPGLDEAVKFVTDGTYLALRIMHQDVAGFNRFLEDNARLLAPVLGRSQADTIEWLAAKMLGRWRTGEPLALCPDQRSPACALSNDFDYTDDPQGMKCPASAHIRVVNPRSEVIDPPHRPIPRLLRRGMPYGPRLEGIHDDGMERGLIGLFLCNSLHANFEKLLTWINRNDFAPIFSELKTLRAQDPLLGNRAVSLASKEFLMPRAAGNVKGVGLTTFVQSRGTAYFLLPGLKALRRLAGLLSTDDA